MAYEVELSFSAQRDRDRIVEYLLYELKSPQAALRFLDELDRVVELIGFNPELFAVSQEPRLLKLEYRKALVMKYLALYKVEGQTVKVARIFHSSQDYARLV